MVLTFADLDITNKEALWNASLWHGGHLGHDLPSDHNHKGKGQRTSPSQARLRNMTARLCY